MIKFLQNQLKKDLPEIRPGDTVKVYQKIKEAPAAAKAAAGKKTTARQRIIPFEGVILARKHGKGASATITVRKVVSGIGVERIFPLHSPSIKKIEIIRKGKARRAKLYYLREAKGKRARIKERK